MTRVAVIIFVLLVSVVDASAQVARVTAERTNLRDRPSTDGAIVEGLARGAELDVLERAGTWYRVRVRATGREGFVSSLLVETSGVAVAPAPAPAVPPASPAASAPPPTPETVAPDPPPSAPPAPLPTAVQKSLEFGLRLGLNRSTVDTTEDDVDALSARSTLAGGGLARLWVRDRIALQVEALYSPQGATFENPVADAVLKLDYLQVPVLALASFGSGRIRPFVLAGPVVGFRLSAKVEVDDSTEDVSEFLSTSDVGVIVGGGVDFGRLTFDARYQLGLKNIDREAESGTTTKNRVLMLGASVRF